MFYRKKNFGGQARSDGFRLYIYGCNTVGNVQIFAVVVKARQYDTTFRVYPFFFKITLDEMSNIVAGTDDTVRHGWQKVQKVTDFLIMGTKTQ